MEGASSLDPLFPGCCNTRMEGSLWQLITIPLWFQMLFGSKPMAVDLIVPRQLQQQHGKAPLLLF